MGFSWTSLYYLTDEEYKQAIAERQAKAKKTVSVNLPPK
jgi:hypothetical protein